VDRLRCRTPLGITTQNSTKQHSTFTNHTASASAHAIMCCDMHRPIHVHQQPINLKLYLLLLLYRLPLHPQWQLPAQLSEQPGLLLLQLPHTRRWRFRPALQWPQCWWWCKLPCSYLGRQGIGAAWAVGEAVTVKFSRAQLGTAVITLLCSFACTMCASPQAWVGCDLRLWIAADLSATIVLLQHFWTDFCYLSHHLAWAGMHCRTTAV
jgi:hypothetical protein